MPHDEWHLKPNGNLDQGGSWPRNPSTVRSRPDAGRHNQLSTAHRNIIRLSPAPASSLSGAEPRTESGNCGRNDSSVPCRCTDRPGEPAYSHQLAFCCHRAGGGGSGVKAAAAPASEDEQSPKPSQPCCSAACRQNHHPTHQRGASHATFRHITSLKHAFSLVTWSIYDAGARVFTKLCACESRVHIPSLVPAGAHRFLEPVFSTSLTPYHPKNFFYISPCRLDGLLATSFLV
jgi:hypothetical protein